MRKVLGIDIGTSSIKLLLTGSGVPVELSGEYEKSGAAELICALKKALCELSKQVPLTEIDAVGLSGQTGTYLLTDRDGEVRYWLGWYEAGREAALKKLLCDVPQEVFLRTTGMEHPMLASYPLPTIGFLRENCPKTLQSCRLLQPKDWLCLLLSGQAVSDVGSWRGMVNPKNGMFEEALLQYAGIGANQLPRMCECVNVSAHGARLTGLREGVPLFVGQNDFYAGLTGIGISGVGFCFDVTGTSEHFGVTIAALQKSPMICSPFFDCYVHYGVTASSGVSLSWARSRFGAEEPRTFEKSPVFLPYLRGERAPVFDSHARGMFVGLSDATDFEAMKYSVYEGVAFSLFNIWEALCRPDFNAIRTTGGAAASALLNRLKAAMFDRPVISEALTCGSAMGAAKLAGGEWTREQQVYDPEPELRDRLLTRYEVYKRMYTAWRDMTENADTGRIF